MVDNNFLNKRGIVFSLIALSTISLVVFVISFLSFKGIMAMMYWLFPLEILFFIVLLLVYISPIVMLLLRNKINLPNHTKKIMTLIIFGILINVIFLVMLFYHPLGNIYGPYSSVLLLTDEANNDKMPTLALVLYTNYMKCNKQKCNIELNLTNLNSNETVTIPDSPAGGKRQVFLLKHVFLLKDLDFDTNYSYLVSNWFDKPVFFHTFPYDNKSMKIIFSSDFHFASKKTDKGVVLKLLNYTSKNADFFIYGGDLTEWGFRNSDWINYLGSASEYISKIPSVYIMGNHDSMFGGESYFYKYLTIYNRTREINKKDYTSYCTLYKLNEFTSLITLDLEWGNGENIEKQLACLDSKLNPITKEDWIIVSFHSFMFSSGSELLGKDWSDQDPNVLFFLHSRFVNSGVDFVLSGHNHQLELLQNEGVNYLVAGGSGSKREPNATNIGSGSKWSSFSEFGLAEIDILNSTDAKIIFRDYDGEELYSESINNNPSKF